MKIGFIGVGNLGEKAVTKLSKDYDLFLSDPIEKDELKKVTNCLLYTSPSPRD